MSGGLLVELKARRIHGKAAPREIWTKQALRAQRAVAATKRVPVGRVAILATNLEGSEATAVLSLAPPEFSLEPSAQRDVPLEFEGTAGALVAGLLHFAWNHLEGSRKAFRFDAPDELVLEGMWWGEAARMLVKVGTEGEEWMAVVRSETDAEAIGLTDQLAETLASVLLRQPVGRLDGDDQPVCLCVS